MTYALQNLLREQFARELDAIGKRKRSRGYDPRAACLVPRPFTREERLFRAEEAQRVVDTVIARKLWAPDPRLDQWVERVWCMSMGMVGAAAAATIPLGPHDVMGGAANIVGYLTADAGVTQAGTVSAWASQIGGTTLDLAQATSGNRPTYAANDATLFGRASITGDGTDDNLFGTWDPPTPGTTPNCFRFVGKFVTNATARRIWGGGTNMMIFRSNSGTSTLVETTNVVVSGTLTMTAGTWYRGLIHYANSAAADEMQIGANTTGTGLSFGNTNPTSWGILATAAAGNAANFAFHDILVMNVKPTTLQRALFDGIDARYFNSVVTV